LSKTVSTTLSTSEKFSPSFMFGNVERKKKHVEDKKKKIIKKLLKRNEEKRYSEN